MQEGWGTAALTIAAAAVWVGSACAQGFGFSPAGGDALMLRVPEVQTELKLTDAQKTKVQQLLEQLGEERQGAFQELLGQGPEAIQKKRAEWRASEEEKVNGILNTDQQKRYRQLRLQHQGITAVADKAVADALKFTEEQRGKVQAILTEQRQSMRSLFGSGGGPGSIDLREIQTKIEALWKQSTEKIAAVLTEDQKKQWKEMLGAAFTFPPFGPSGQPAGGRLGS